MKAFCSLIDKTFYVRFYGACRSGIIKFDRYRYRQTWGNVGGLFRTLRRLTVCVRQEGNAVKFFSLTCPPPVGTTFLIRKPRIELHRAGSSIVFFCQTFQKALVFRALRRFRFFFHHSLHESKQNVPSGFFGIPRRTSMRILLTVHPVIFSNSSGVMSRLFMRAPIATCSSNCSAVMGRISYSIIFSSSFLGWSPDGDFCTSSSGVFDQCEDRLLDLGWQ